MRTSVALVLAAIFAVCFAAKYQQAAIDAVNIVNNNKESTWVAEHNAFSAKSDDELKEMMGVFVPRSAAKFQRDEKRSGASANAPDNFDSRQQWPNCIHPIRNQQQCGSCWAFAGSEVLSDRFCIASNGSINVVLSPQDLVSCDSGDYGCNGGMLGTEWNYMVHSGVVSDDCFPYVSGDGHVPVCPSTCQNTGKPFSSDKHFAKSYEHVGALFFGREKKIQDAIQSAGPVEGAFYVYRDFMSYKSGVYKHTTGALLGGHAIKIVGWGVDNTSSPATPYWIVANSWGTTWGMNGFFWILRGHNECNLEAQVYAGTPKI